MAALDDGRRGRGASTTRVRWPVGFRAHFARAGCSLRSPPRPPRFAPRVLVSCFQTDHADARGGAGARTCAGAPDRDDGGDVAESAHCSRRARVRARSPGAPRVGRLRVVRPRGGGLHGRGARDHGAVHDRGAWRWRAAGASLGARASATHRVVRPSCARQAYQKWQANRPKTNIATRMYAGGFEDEMTRAEAAKILGLRCVRVVRRLSFPFSAHRGRSEPPPLVESRPSTSVPPFAFASQGERDGGQDPGAAPEAADPEPPGHGRLDVPRDQGQRGEGDPPQGRRRAVVSAFATRVNARVRGRVRDRGRRNRVCVDRGTRRRAFPPRHTPHFRSHQGPTSPGIPTPQMRSFSIFSLRERIWDLSGEPSAAMTEAEITGRETPHARPSAALEDTNT